MKHDSATIQRFLELRALGQTLFSISDELKVPISTLGDWNKRHAQHLAHERAVKWEHCENGAGLNIETDLIRLARRIYTCELELGRRPLHEMKTSELLKLLAQSRREYFRRRDPFLKPLNIAERPAPRDPSRSASAESESHDASFVYAAEAASFPVAHEVTRGPYSYEASTNQPPSSAYAANDVISPTQDSRHSTLDSAPSPAYAASDSPPPLPNSPTHSPSHSLTFTPPPGSPSPRLSASAVQLNFPHPEISGNISGFQSQPTAPQSLTTPEICISDFRITPPVTPFKLAPVAIIADMVRRMKCALVAVVLLAQIGLAALPEGVINTQQPKDKPLSPAEALQRITLPPGFRAQLFAAEPDVFQPIAFDFDDRGRLWVVECFSYPDFKRQDNDRVLIFTDADGDGKFDQRTIFLANGHRLSGITLGFGGVWLCSPPNLLFIPDANGDDIADGQPVIHLDGFTRDAQHNMMNGLAWGPDGWPTGVTASSGTR